MIALAASADGEALVRTATATRSAGWPGTAPGSTSVWPSGTSACPAASSRGVLGGHGVICWADTSDGVRDHFVAAHRPGRGLPRRRGAAPSRSARSCRPRPLCPKRPAAPRRPCSHRWCAGWRDRPSGGRPLQRRPRGPRLPRERAAPRLAALGTSCPDHFLRTKVRPLLLDLGPHAPRDERVARLHELHADVPRELRRVLRGSRRRRPRPPMRGADPVIVLLPGRGHVQLRRRRQPPLGSRASST